jgi:predicted flap endonuclease-1-like 5' DNA nuclease
MENSNSMTAIIILLLLMLAAFVVGYLISRLFGGGSTDTDDSIHADISEKEAELEACKSNYASINAKIDAVKATAATIKVNSLSSNVATENADTSSLAAVSGSAGAVAAAGLAAVANRKDDLKIVEGIGPKIEELLNNAGIQSFAQLADTSAARLNEILEAAGPRYQMHDPGTWAQQSALCRDNKWTELKILQDDLNKGKTE